MEVKILCRDNDKPCNRELIEFLNKHLEDLIVKNVRFKFRVVAEPELEAVVKSGIKRLPVGIFNQKTYTGSVEIKSFLMGMMNRSTTKSSSSPEEDLAGWYASEMTPEAKERDDQNDDSKQSMTDVVKRATEAMQERNEMHKQERKKSGFSSRDPKNAKRGDNVRSQDQPGGQRPRTPGPGEHRETPVDVRRAVQTGDKDDNLVASMFDETPL